MFVTKKRYNEMKDYYDKRIDEYIREVSSLEADVDTLRSGIIHAMCYLYDPEKLDVATAMSRLRIGFDVAKYNDGCYKPRLMDNFRKIEQ